MIRSTNLKGYCVEVLRDDGWAACSPCFFTWGEADYVMPWYKRMRPLKEFRVYTVLQEKK